MEQATPNHPSGTTNGRRQMDFVSPRPKPVTSAKDAINAMYANRQPQPEPDQPALTAREMVNAAASQTTNHSAKSAASVHHGPIQKSMNSTRMSASALLRIAEQPRLASDQLQPKSSFDPLARPAVPEPKSVSDADRRQEVPVVRTSLKLGAAARPKQPPVILPPNARMARVARPVQSEPTAVIHRKKPGNLLSHQHPVDAQIIQPNTLNSGLKRRAIEGIRPAAKAPTQVKVTAQPTSNHDPKPTSKPKPQPTSSEAIRNAAAEVIQSRSQAKSRPHFRTAPKNYATSQPQPIAVDSSYVMTAPPKIDTSHHKSRVAQDMAELGMTDSSRPKSAGDHAPIGQAQSQAVASGSGRASSEAPAIKETNTSNYSFSRKDSAKPVDNNRYALGGESPFLKTVNVEKRPLSDTPVSPRPAIERRKIETKSEPATKSGRKNVYPKKTDQTKKSRKSKADETVAPSRPTVIIPTSHRSKLPLFFLVLFTILLGALVGAAAYLCFFQ